MNSDSTNILVDVDLEVPPTLPVSQNDETVKTIRLSQQQSCDSIDSDGKTVSHFLFFTNLHSIYSFKCIQ